MQLQGRAIPDSSAVVVAREIAFPNWDGNGMYVSLGNLAANPAVGLLFVDFEQQKRLRHVRPSPRSTPTTR